MKPVTRRELFLNALSHPDNVLPPPITREEMYLQEAINYIKQGGGGGAYETETYTISAWTALADSSPFTYQATVTATHEIGADTVVELVNDQAVLFANYGFAIGAVSGQSVTIYAIGQPSASVSLGVRFYG